MKRKRYFMIPSLPNRQKKTAASGHRNSTGIRDAYTTAYNKMWSHKTLVPRTYNGKLRVRMYRTIATLPKHHTRNTSGILLHARINTPLKALRLNAQGRMRGYCAGSHTTQFRNRHPGITSMVGTRQLAKCSWRSVNKRNGKGW